MKKDIFEPIHHMGNKLEATPSEQAWSRLEKKLDRHVEVKRKKRREIFNLNVYWIAATIIGILAITSISVFIIKNKQENTLASLPNMRNEVSEVAPQQMADLEHSAGTQEQLRSISNASTKSADQKAAFSPATKVEEKASVAASAKNVKKESAASLAISDGIIHPESGRSTSAEVSAIQEPTAVEDGLRKTAPSSKRSKVASMDDRRTQEEGNFNGVWLDKDGQVVLEINDHTILFEGRKVQMEAPSGRRFREFQLLDRRWTLTLLSASKMELARVASATGSADKKILNRK